MAYADYLHCAVCDRKSIYDAELDYESVNNEESGGLYDIAVICHKCAKTHSIKIENKPTLKRVSDFLE